MKRLSFTKLGGKTWHVKNKKGESLGVVEYYAKWKGFIWEQDLTIIMSTDCLQEVVDFMKKKDKGGKV